MTRKLTLVYAFLLITALSFAQGTRTWEQSRFEDLEKGTSDGVAIRSDGGIELAPAFKALITTPSPYVWSIAADHGGNLYAATGTPARVYRITPDGKSSVIFQSQELQVQALAVDDNGIVYAATNPDGKVFRLEGAASGPTKGQNKNKSAEPDTTWTSSVFFDPGSKYIWDLALDKSGTLYVATGDHGEIFRVTSAGEHTVFFKSDEAHIRVLGFDRQDNLIAGSDGSGLIYRISPNGEGFVLYSAPKKEITALAVDAVGNIYAAGAGEKSNGPAAPSLSNSSSPPPASMQPNSGPALGLSMGNPIPVVSGFGNSGSSASGGSEIYRIAADGSPTRIWISRDDLVYALAFNSNGQLLAGTGNRGHIFLVSGDDKFTDLLKASASQVTAFAHGPKNGLYASSSNLGKIFLLSTSPNANGTYVSDVFDARIFSRWGRVELRGSGNVELFARSGNVDNPDRNWSPWKKIEWQKDAGIALPPARFIQWKAVLYAGTPEPRVDSVTINYLSKNVAPDFDDVTVQEGVRYQPGSKSSGDNGGNPPGDSQHVDSAPSPILDRDSIGVRWSVHDDNDDNMAYAIYYRGEGESRWLLLKDSLTDKFYSFDSSLLPDGAYTIKVIASDALSHSPGQGLSAERESARFEMDTTQPRIEDLRGSVEGGQVHVTFRAVDSFSPIQKAEYSVDAGDWQLVEPVGQISDSKTERYDFHADLQPGIGLRGGNGVSAEHVVVVRAYDRHDNMASAKTVIGEK
jgi:sugar lactone lactonase YvrE